MKYNSGTTAQNEVPDGKYYVEIDGVVYVDASGLFNRHYSNAPIDRVELLGWAQSGTAPFEILYDDFRITTGGFYSSSTPPPSGDNIAPTVSLSSPSAGSASGTVSVSATASDNVGVAGVQFVLDGTNLSSEDTSSPYSVSWDTTTATNGAHVLTATARDAAGNTTTSGPVSVNVSNSVTPPPPTVGGLLFYSTLDSLASLTSPSTGTGSGASVVTTPANDFVTGQTGSGLQIDTASEYGRIQQTNGSTQNIELDKGTVDFWYKPNYAHTDGIRYALFTIGDMSIAGTSRILLTKGAASNANALQVLVWNGSGVNQGGNFTVASTDYSFTPGVWVNMRLTWDFTVASGVRNTHLYINSQEPTTSGGTTGPVSMGAESTSNYVYIGNRATNSSGGDYANGVIDEFKIYDSALTP